MPGQSWRDRPAVDRGEGVFLAGDMVAAPGLLSEVSWASAIEAGRLALGYASTSRPSAAQRRVVAACSDAQARGRERAERPFARGGPLATYDGGAIAR